MTIQYYKDASAKLKVFNSDMVELRLKTNTASFSDVMTRLSPIQVLMENIKLMAKTTAFAFENVRKSIEICV